MTRAPRAVLVAELRAQLPFLITLLVLFSAWTGFFVVADLLPDTPRSTNLRAVDLSAPDGAMAYGHMWLLGFFVLLAGYESFARDRRSGAAVWMKTLPERGWVVPTAKLAVGALVVSVPLLVNAGLSTAISFEQGGMIATMSNPWSYFRVQSLMALSASAAYLGLYVMGAWVGMRVRSRHSAVVRYLAAPLWFVFLGPAIGVTIFGLFDRAWGLVDVRLGTGGTLLWRLFGVAVLAAILTRSWSRLEWTEAGEAEA